jgi:hypothetical protein
VVNSDIAISEISDAELDMVVGASGVNLSHLVTVNLPINIAIGVQNQTNISILSLTQQGGSQTLINGLFNNL